MIICIIRDRSRCYTPVTTQHKKSPHQRMRTFVQHEVRLGMYALAVTNRAVPVRCDQMTSSFYEKSLVEYGLPPLSILKCISANFPHPLTIKGSNNNYNEKYKKKYEASRQNRG